MDSQRALEIIEGAGAIKRNTHAVFTSGKHSATYVNKDDIYPDTVATADLCAGLAMHFYGMGLEYDVVAAPEKGGIILAQWTAYNSVSLWKQGKKVQAVYAEKESDKEGFYFGRGYDARIRGKRVLVVEDNLSTGGSVISVCRAVRDLDGEVVAIGALCNLGGLTAEKLGVPEFHALVTMNVVSWLEEECPLCVAGVPVNTEVGKGKQYLARKAAAVATG